MKNFQFIALIFSLLLGGCMNSDGFYELKGKVVDENTRVTIPNRKIIINALVKIDDNFVPKYVGEFYSDSFGCFEYALKKSKTSYLYDFYVVGDSAYAFSNFRLGLTEFRQEGNFLSFQLRKLTDLTIKIEKKSKTLFRDTLFVSWQSDGIDGESLYPYKIVNYGISSDLALRWIGGNVKSVIKTKVFADKKTIIRLELFRNGRPKEIIDTIFCQREVANELYFKY